MQMTIKSPYANLEKDYDSCLTFNWQKLRQMTIKKTPGYNCQMIRVLLNVNDFIGRDQEIINYLNDLLSTNPNIGFHINVEDTKCFPLAKRVMAQIRSNNKSIRLFPDNILGDRTILDLSGLNCKTIIPLQYAMWHNDLGQANSNLLFARKDNGDFDGHLPFSKYEQNELGLSSGYYDLATVLRIKKEILAVLNSDLRLTNPHNDLQKALLVSAYMSRNIGYMTYNNNPNFSVLYNSQDHDAGLTLARGKGVCEGIAEAFMLLLNNPVMQVDCRTLVGINNQGGIPEGHAWNLIKIKESRNYYLFDQTWHDSESDHEYAFFSIDPSHIPGDGANGQFNIASEKLPEGFLEEQYQEALNRERTGLQIIINRNIDELLAEYKQKQGFPKR